MAVRRPAVAGQFYPGSAGEIEEQLNELIDPGAKKEKVLGAISPHAGWMYSGRAAGVLFSRIEIPGEVIVICPNHRGAGAAASIMSEGEWELPGGVVKLSGAFAGALKARCGFLKEDSRAHAAEHSLEVQLPFIRKFRPDFKLTPISLSRLSYDECVELGEAIAYAVESSGKGALVVASSDMTHFENAKSARKKDELALRRVESLDPEGLYKTVLANHITMCGFIPAAVMLVYAKKRGAVKAEVVDYRNSGDVTGDYSDVVAYAAAIVK